MKKITIFGKTFKEEQEANQLGTDPIEIKVKDTTELYENLKQFSNEGVWLATNGYDFFDDKIRPIIFIEKDMERIIELIYFIWNDAEYFNIQHYGSYEDAYSVAKDMRELEPECYDN